ncbi:MAG: hypothetical protein ACNI3A_02815 [Desulfovibrio sp.]
MGCYFPAMMLYDDFDNAALLAERTVLALGSRNSEVIITACPT